MFDRIFSAALAFCVLAGGTLAVGTAMLEQHPASSAALEVVQLERVEVIGKRVGESRVAVAETADADKVQ